jgi:hypothetical protein
LNDQPTEQQNGNDGHGNQVVDHWSAPEPGKAHEREG